MAEAPDPARSAAAEKAVEEMEKASADISTGEEVPDGPGVDAGQAP
jgi:hypothetical protein